MKEILLSIIIPMYNVQDYIVRCLESLEEQDISQEEYEIILINDGSPDRSLEYAEKFSQNYTNIKIFSQENKGQSAARNFGIDKAKGKYLWFVDSDDYVIANSLKLILERAIENDLDILSFNTKISKNLEKIPEEKNLNKDKIEIEKIYSGIDYIANYYYANVVWDCIYRTQYLKETEAKFIVGRHCEDSIFKLETLSRAERTAHLPFLTYIYFTNPTSIMNNKEKSHYEKMIRDYMFVVDFFSSFIEKKEKTNINVKYLKRIKTRRDSFVFFLLVRLIKSKLSYSEVVVNYKSLENKGYIPLENFIGIDYNTKIYKILNYIFNKKSLFILAVKAFKAKNRITSSERN